MASAAAKLPSPRNLFRSAMSGSTAGRSRSLGSASPSRAVRPSRPIRLRRSARACSVPWSSSVSASHCLIAVSRARITAAIASPSRAPAATPNPRSASAMTSGSGAGGTGTACAPAACPARAQPTRDGATRDGATRDGAAWAGGAWAGGAGPATGGGGEAPEKQGKGAQPVPLPEVMAEAERRFGVAAGARDATAMVAVILALETAIEQWEADTDEDQGTEQARAVLRSLIGRLGRRAADGLTDPRDRLRPAVEPLIALRNTLRAEGNFAAADAIRHALTATGLDLSDTPEDTRWETAETVRGGGDPPRR